MYASNEPKGLLKHCLTMFRSNVHTTIMRMTTAPTWEMHSHVDYARYVQMLDVVSTVWFIVMTMSVTTPTKQSTHSAMSASVFLELGWQGDLLFTVSHVCLHWDNILHS